MRAYYAGHDKEYAKRRAAGNIGWDTAEDLHSALTDLNLLLASDAAPKHGKLLELGCGAGDQSLWLAAQGYEVSGVDIAPNAIAWANEKAVERGLRADFRVGDVLDLEGFDDASFNVVLDGHCFHCIIGEDRARFLATAHRMLAPNGVFLVATMCGDPIPEDALAKFDPVSRCTVSGDIATRYFGKPESLLAEIRAAGFETLFASVQASEGPDDQDILLVQTATAS